MRVAFISTFPPIECGIGTYCSYLCDALIKLQNEILVISPFGAQGRNVFPVYHTQDTDMVSRIFNVSVDLTPDIIHIQHEFGLYGSQRGVQVIELIMRYKLAGVPVAVTFHTVYPKMMYDEDDIILKSIVNESSAVIVHEDYQKDILRKKFGNESKIHVIHHGVREIGPIPNAKQKLELEGKKVILICGYFRPSKGLHKVIKWFPEIAKRNENAILLIAGKLRSIRHIEYQKQFFESINNSPAFDKIKVLRGQFPQKTFDTIVSSSDVVVLPYEIGGQSGILAQCYAFHRPAITSDLFAFKKSFERSKGGLVCTTENDFIENITKIISDDNLNNQYRQNIKNYVEKTAGWSYSAKKYMEVYQSIIKVPYGKAKYIYFE